MHACAALQVLVSIQGLVLVPKPYFNEAGYERQVRVRCSVSARCKPGARWFDNSFLAMHPQSPPLPVPALLGFTCAAPRQAPA
jgi:hypothetical protein